MSETYFGTGGQYACSGNQYCANETAGETGVGNTKGTAYQAQAGFNTNRAPSLTFIVPPQDIKFGVLTPGTPATANATFSVKSYLSSGYIVQTYGAAPTNGSHTLFTCLPIGRNCQGINPAQEQFGMNLVANTTPTTFGADPAQAPDSTFGFGSACGNYAGSGNFGYASGDTIACSNSSSGETDYTISYAINVTPLTPGGTYTMNQYLVATATF